MFEVVDGAADDHRARCLEMVQHLAEVSGVQATQAELDGCNRSSSATKASYDCVMAAKDMKTIAR